MAYSEVGEMLIGAITISDKVNKQNFINEAADEIDSKLGFIYRLPLAPADVVTPDGNSWMELPRHEVLLLKTISNRLATGRLILSIDTAGEQTQLHAYGWYLVQEALAELMALANQVVDLTAVKIPLSESGQSDMTASVRNHDEESLLLGFENTVMRGEPWYSIPGQVS